MVGAGIGRRLQQIEIRRHVEPQSKGHIQGNINIGNDKEVLLSAVEELAQLAHMSVSSFHQHFKSVTSMSPLQYQKVVRLQEARRLMLSTMMDVSNACLHVGYQSTSQFSREYSRFFGRAPTRDISRLLEQGFTAADVSR